MRRSLIALVAFPLLVGSLTADELRTLDGKTVIGSLQSIDDVQLTVETKDGPASTPLAQALAVDLSPVKGIADGVKYHQLRLIDDSEFSCRDVRFGGESVDVTLVSGHTLKLPISAVAWFVRGAENGVLRKKFEAVANQKVRRDRIVILRDGELNPLEGTLGDIDAAAQTIPFKRDGADAIPIPLERLHGLVFYRTEGASETPICKVIDREGNVFTASKLAYQDKSWKLATSFGTSVTLPEGAVARLDFNMGKLTYLSDLDPSRVIERSGIGFVMKYRKNANLDGEPIFIDRRYARGLSMHAHTELEFDLAGKFKSLKGTLGIDIRTGADSEPLVTIYCDGEKRFSETITPKAPRPIHIDVQDVRTLRIVVSSRNELDLHDHVSFADARVSQ